MSEGWTIENVDFYEVGREEDMVSIKFLDLFDRGEEYMLSVEDAAGLRDALTQMINEV